MRRERMQPERTLPEQELGRTPMPQTIRQSNQQVISSFQFLRVVFNDPSKIFAGMSYKRY
jgi:hypothetical protein